jgi:hypothetical protein
MSMQKIGIGIAFTAALLIGGANIVKAEEYTLVIKDHKFLPETLEVPAGQKVKIKIANQDPTPEEFESYELNREKIIRGNSTGIVFVGPLAPGSYPFFGEFNMGTAKGQIVAK